MIAWGLEKIIAAEARRDWQSLPSSFEADAVHYVYQQIKPHFDKRSPRERIAASKAVTFKELRRAVGI